jgi:hypothetical protein
MCCLFTSHISLSRTDVVGHCACSLCPLGIYNIQTIGLDATTWNSILKESLVFETEMKYIESVKIALEVYHLSPALSFSWSVCLSVWISLFILVSLGLPPCLSHFTYSRQHYSSYHLLPLARRQRVHEERSDHRHNLRCGPRCHHPLAQRPAQPWVYHHGRIRHSLWCCLCCLSGQVQPSWPRGSSLE